MKITFLVIISYLFAQLSIAQRCGCFVDENASADYLQPSGRTTATINFNVMVLSHGIEIMPEINQPVVFKFVDTPSVKPSCKNSYHIEVYDETERRVIYAFASASPDNLPYSFPKSDRAYTVKLRVQASSRTPIDPGLIANQVCYREMVVIVRPKSKPCDCIINNGKNTLVATGSISYRGLQGLSNQHQYSADIYFVNKSDCILKIESITIGKAMGSGVNPDIKLATNDGSREARFQGTLTSPTLVSTFKEGMMLVNVTIKYNLDGKPCSQNFVMAFTDSNGKK